jgi:transcriptional regulator with XRE-family HTH domain
MPKTLHRQETQVLIELLRDIRLRAGLTQAGLSGKLGRAQSFISDVERGQRRLDLIQVRDVCIAVGLSLPEFVSMLDARIELANEAVPLRAKTKAKAPPRRNASSVTR